MSGKKKLKSDKRISVGAKPKSSQKNTLAAESKHDTLSASNSILRFTKFINTKSVFALVTWIWASLYYAPVMAVSQYYSYWSADSRLMEFWTRQSWAPIRSLGRFLLTSYHYPLLGGTLLTILLMLMCGLTGRILRLKGWLRFIHFLPAVAYMGIVSYHGFDIFFETETGYIMGIPLFIDLALFVLWLLTRFFTHATPQKEEKPVKLTFRERFAGLGITLLLVLCVVGFNEYRRPDVRVNSRLILMEQQQDWDGIAKLARKHASMSNRPQAAYYAIALVHTDQIAYRMYDIRLDYDTLHIHGMDKMLNNANSLYVPECSYHAGFILTSYHNCMEQMMMTGPTVRLLRQMIKCALMRSEWELARKYLRILKEVPFEGKFIRKYEAMVGNTALVDADPEMAKIRLTEPLHDSFESAYQQPLFMGYNIALAEGRSMNALVNSLCACLYTKLLPPFMVRLEPLAGSTPPDIIADGILITSQLQPELLNHFPNLNLRQMRLLNFQQAITPYMKDRPGHAEELFERYKGYYPYYYYFGNLRATKKGYTGGTIKKDSGVN